jgi:hypothetical protein
VLGERADTRVDDELLALDRLGGGAQLRVELEGAVPSRMRARSRIVLEAFAHDRLVGGAFDPLELGAGASGERGELIDLVALRVRAAVEHDDRSAADEQLLRARMHRAAAGIVLRTRVVDSLAPPATEELDADSILVEERCVESAREIGSERALSGAGQAGERDERSCGVELDRHSRSRVAHRSRDAQRPSIHFP